MLDAEDVRGGAARSSWHRAHRSPAKSGSLPRFHDSSTRSAVDAANSFARAQPPSGSWRFDGRTHSILHARAWT